MCSQSRDTRSEGVDVNVVERQKKKKIDRDWQNANRDINNKVSENNSHICMVTEELAHKMSTLFCY